MIKIVQVWFTLSIAIGLLIYFYTVATGKERWQLTKLVLFAILCATASSLLLFSIYILF